MKPNLSNFYKNSQRSIQQVTPPSHTNYGKVIQLSEHRFKQRPMKNKLTSRYYKQKNEHKIRAQHPMIKWLQAYSKKDVLFNSLLVSTLLCFTLVFIYFLAQILMKSP